MNSEKMSKSLGNVLLVKDLLAQAPGEAVRYALITAHYHHPLDWTDATLPQAKHELDKLYLALESLSDVEAEADPAHAPEEIIAAMEEDINTPKALGLLHQVATEANRAGTPEEKKAAKQRLLGGGWLLGLLQQDPAEWFAWKAGGAMDDAAIEALLHERQDARAGRDYARADAIRDELAEAGIAIEDKPDGTRWRYVGKEGLTQRTQSRKGKAKAE